MDRCSIIIPFYDNPERDIFTVGSQAVRSHTFCLEEKMVRCATIQLIHGLLPINCLEVQGLGKSIIRKLVEKDI